MGMSEQEEVQQEASGQSPVSHGGPAAFEQTPAEKRQTYILFALVVIIVSLGALVQTAPNAMIPAIMADFGVSVDLGQWLTTAYMLVIGISVPISTYYSKRLDIKRHVLIGGAVMCAGLLVDYFAPNFWIMLAGRIVQAVSVGMLMPLMQNIAAMRFPAGKKATAMGVAGIALGFAPNVGPTVGGAMEAVVGWRGFFVLALALGVVLVVLVAAFVKNSTPMDETFRFETVSFIYSTLGFGGLLLGLSEASSFGFASALVWVPAAVGMVFLVLFVRRQRMLEQPLTNLDIFKSSQYVKGVLALVFLFASFMGITLIIPLYVQGACGGTSLDAGMVLLPATVMALIINPVSGILTDKYGIKPVARGFVVLLALGAVLWVFVDETTPLFLMMVYQTIRGLGVSGLIGPLQMWALAQLPGRIVPDGSSMTILIRQASASLGTSAMVLAISASQVMAASMAAPALPYRLAFAVSAVFACACLIHIFAHVK